MINDHGEHFKVEKSTTMALRQLIYKKKDEHDKDHRVDAQL